MAKIAPILHRAVDLTPSLTQLAPDNKPMLSSMPVLVPVGQPEEVCLP